MITPNSDTQLFGILGNPLSHTLSPTLHNSLFESLGLNALYLVFPRERDEIPSPSEWRRWKIRGLSVTIPYKEWASQNADHLDESSQFMQASNTLVFQEQGVFAYNTDGRGALRAIQTYATPHWKTKNILILGNGGSAKGILYSLLQNTDPSQLIYLVARNQNTSLAIQERLSTDLQKRIRLLPLEEILSVQKETNLVIQTTSVGMKGQDQKSLVPIGFWTPEMNAFDIVYNPTETVFCQEAKSKSANLIPGLAMLLFQGIVQFELFTGIQPPEDLVKTAYQKMIHQLNQKT